MNVGRHNELSGKLWEIANRLRGPYRPPQYRLVMLPIIVLRRFDCVLEPTRDKVLAEHKRLAAAGTPEAAMEKLHPDAGKRNRQPVEGTDPMTRAPQGRSLELFFIDGKPDGMQTAEEINWTGHVLLTPRTRIVDALKRKQAQHTGVYLLLGNDSKTGEPMLYVGESENMAGRIRSHDTGKDWWTTAVLIATGANTLHKAHVRYLEARLVKIARSVGRINLDNANKPGGASLHEAAENSVEVFLDTLMMVLPAMRIDCFLEQTRPRRARPVSEDDETPVFELVIKKHGIAATAIVESGEMIVQEGSRARTAWSSRNATHSSYANLHADLVRSGVLKPDGGNAVFTGNYAFNSPSAAGRRCHRPPHQRDR